METQARTSYLRSHLDCGNIDQDEFQFLKEHPDHDLSDCPTCFQPVFDMQKHVSLNPNCNDTDTRLDLLITFPSGSVQHDGTKTERPLDNAGWATRKSKRPGKPSAKRLALDKDREEREEAKRAKHTEYTDDLSHGYCSSPNHFQDLFVQAGESEFYDNDDNPDDDDDKMPGLLTRPNSPDFSIHSSSSDSSEGQFNPPLPFDEDDSSTDSLPLLAKAAASTATMAAQHMQHVSQPNQNQEPEGEPELLGCTIPAAVIDTIYDYPRLTKYEIA